MHSPASWSGDILLWASIIKGVRHQIGDPSGIRSRVASGGFSLVLAVIPNDDDCRNKTHAPHALGPATGRFVSLGRGGLIVFDMSTSADPATTAMLTVDEAEAADDESESFSVATSAGFNGPWTELGTGSGDTTFEGVTLERYVRIVDSAGGGRHQVRRLGTENSAEPGTTPGFDLECLTVTSSVPSRRVRFDLLHGSRVGR